MKRLILPVCFAATAAVAAGLKDPAAVARDWQENVARPSPPLTVDLSLHGTVDSTKSALSANELLQRHRQKPGRGLPFQRPRLDAPGQTERPDNLPPGAKPYQFEGRTYWLIPLAAPMDS